MAITLLLQPNFVALPVGEKSLLRKSLQHVYASIVYASVCSVYMYLLQKNLYVPTQTSCTLAIPLKHALREYAAHQGKKEVNMVSV